MLREAFERVCTDFTTAQRYYVTLVEHVPFYGGPEEGGWFGEDTVIHAYQACASKELAEELASKVRELAATLDQEAKDAYGKQCLREMDWLDARGLEADFLREPDGPSTYSVVVSETVPQESRGERCYS